MFGCTYYFHLSVFFSKKKKMKKEKVKKGCAFLILLKKNIYKKDNLYKRVQHINQRFMTLCHCLTAQILPNEEKIATTLEKWYCKWMIFSGENLDVPLKLNVPINCQCPPIPGSSVCLLYFS